MALYCSHPKVLCCNLAIQGAFWILEGQQNIQQFGGCFVFYFNFSPVSPFIFLPLCCAVYLPSLVTYFLQCLLWSLMGRGGLLPPCLLHREKKDGVPRRTGRHETGQGRLLMLKYYLK